MDYLAGLWAKLAPWVDEATRFAGVVPYPALPVAAVPLVAALLSGSLVAIVLALILVWISGATVLAAPLDQQSWAVFYAGCAASLLATAVAFHRRRLWRRVQVQDRRLGELTGELEDLRARYEREMMWRNASTRPVLDPALLDSEGGTSTATRRL
jgi:membrane protein implicated in regulation of membrane protease activity